MLPLQLQLPPGPGPAAPTPPVSSGDTSEGQPTDLGLDLDAQGVSQSVWSQCMASCYGVMHLLATEILNSVDLDRAEITGTSNRSHITGMNSAAQRT